MTESPIALRLCRRDARKLLEQLEVSAKLPNFGKVRYVDLPNGRLYRSTPIDSGDFKLESVSSR